VAYDQQGLVFAVAMEGGAIKLFDSRSYDKVLGLEIKFLNFDLLRICQEAELSGLSLTQFSGAF
jgi:hypothetical protein